jgi:hypothetical protein
MINQIILVLLKMGNQVIKQDPNIVGFNVDFLSNMINKEVEFSFTPFTREYTYKNNIHYVTTNGSCYICVKGSDEGLACVLNLNNKYNFYQNGVFNKKEAELGALEYFYSESGKRVIGVLSSIKYYRERVWFPWCPSICECLFVLEVVINNIKYRFETDTYFNKYINFNKVKYNFSQSVERKRHPRDFDTDYDERESDRKMREIDSGNYWGD